MKYNIRFENETFTVSEMIRSRFERVLESERAIEKHEKKLDREFTIVIW
jgi:hypothetical protein